MDLNSLKNQVKEIAATVADFIREEATNFESDQIEQKGKNDLVSYVDREAERMLVEKLTPLIKDASFLTEEKTIEQKSADIEWIVDPLDGTTNFIHGIPAYSISIALRNSEDIVLGVVYEVSNKECFSGIKGGGSFLNDRPISVSRVTTLGESLIAMGFPVQYFDKKAKYLEIVSELISNSHGIRRFGSAALDLCYVASGRCDGFFECNLNPWDVAAGALIVQEAGGKVTDFSGEDNFLHGREIVAATTVHQELLATIQKFWD